MNELLRKILYLPPQASSVARDIDHLHYWVISVTMLGALLVALVAAYFLLKYHKSARLGSALPDTHPRREPGGLPYWLEFAVIALLLALFVGWWVVGFRQFVRLQTPPPGAIEIYATGKQWMWSFAYPNGRGSNAVLHVPVNRPVRLVMSSRDVIHSLYVPHFRVKKDLVPGYSTTLWFEATELGTFPILCTEYCGTGHSTMRAQVVVSTESDYLQRIAEMPVLDLEGPEYREPAQVGRGPEEALSLAEMGERVAVIKGCMRCHTADGTPHIGPTWANAYGGEVLLESGARVPVDEAYLTESMMDPLAKLHHGFPAVMPSYQGLISAAETGALIEYIRALKDAPREQRLSPLAPAAAPDVRLPTDAQRPLDSSEIPRPLEGAPEPRPDPPPFSPPGTEQETR